MFLIDKTFEFCYGHRVWTQKLFGEYADDLKCACRHLHGHEAKVQVYLSSVELNETGMVTDFRHLEWLKRWFNTYVDHRFVVDIDDPFADTLIAPINGANWRSNLVDVYAGPVGVKVAREINPALLPDPSTHEFEVGEGILIVNFVPTSENLSKWVYDMVQPNMRPLNVTVEKVDWWETPKSRSSFIPNIFEKMK